MYLKQLDILGMDLMYYDGMVLVEDGNGSQIYGEEESAEEEETDDGLPTGWREVDLEGVDATTPLPKYIKKNGDTYYVRDLTYHYVGTKDGKPVYKLLSDYDAYESQWKMYGVNINEVDGSPQAAAENNPYWILNETLFGMNVDAYAEVDTEWYVFSRDTFIFDVPTADTTAGITFSAVRSYVNVRIPLQQNFAADTYHEDSLNNFIANEREKAINPTREMEKNVYKPAVIIEENDGGTTYKPVKRIEFNLHFRKRNLLNGEWSIIRKNKAGAQELWNGVDVKTTTSTIDNETVTTVTYATRDNFFSYEEKQRQSDLLMFLGFTNNDVRYQRNKLKKTFLRLSIYDSEDEATQNLLAYYTVFYDNNKAFRKFAQYFDTTDFDEKKTYYIIDSDDYTKIDEHDEKYGIRVSREMCNTGDEEERLSSQFVVEDRNNTNSSSEGFYFYLWKDNYNPPVYGDCDGNDLFMRVEFNHAGYGRVVPFMMPFDDAMNILTFDGEDGVLKTYEFSTSTSVIHNDF